MSASRNRRPDVLGALLGAAALLALLGAAATGEARLRAAITEPIAWTDLDGRRYGPLDLRAAKATVFIFSSTECPIANLYTPRMVDLHQEYAARGVRFFLVNSHALDTPERLRHYVRERKIPFPAVKDRGTELADRLGAQMTPEAVVVGRDGSVLYRGRIDDHPDRTKVRQQDLREALDAILAGKPVPNPRTEVQGCVIERLQPEAPARRARVTWAEHVAPLLYRNCAECHRPGEVAPFSVLTYEEARAHAQQMAIVTRERRMPPWKALPGYGEFHNARVLTPEEVQILADWAASGAPAGDRRQAPRPPRFASGWPLGEPDLVLKPKAPYRLAADGEDVYQCFVLPVEFKEDTWVVAAQFAPDNRAVVHHMIIYADPTGKAKELDAQDPAEGFTNPTPGNAPVRGAMMLAGWAPGNSPARLPAGVARKIPKGTTLVLEVHYFKSGKPEVDRSAVGLTFAREEVRQEMSLFGTVRFDLNLPAGNPRIEVEAVSTVPRDMTLHVITPHMHLLGREVLVWAEKPDGSQQVLLWINDWDFKWQEGYRYREPVQLPAGTKIHSVHYFDNSENNPFNPHQPPRNVTWGPKTTDEMAIVFMGVTWDHQQLSVRPKPWRETVVVLGASEQAAERRATGNGARKAATGPSAIGKRRGGA